MTAKRSASVCVSCYRSIEAGAGVRYSKARRGVRHPVCPPISTAELLEGRTRFEREQAQRQDDADVETDRRLARHDAANRAVR